jgi:transketolase
MFYIQKKERRDKLIFSKGHASATLYALLHERGILTEEQLKTFRQFGSPLQGHPSSLWLPEVEFSSGMLGQGLSFANGLAHERR